MMDIILVTAVGLLCIGSFLVGAIIGQTVSNGEKLKAPEITIPTPIKDYRKKKQEEAEQNRIDTIMQNIESYNGTSAGQKDVL